MLFAWGHILEDIKKLSFRLRPSFQISTPEILWPDEGRLRRSQLPGQVDSFRRGCTTVSNSLPRVSINQTCLPPTYPPTKPTFLIIIQLPQKTLIQKVSLNSLNSGSEKIQNHRSLKINATLLRKQPWNGVNKCNGRCGTSASYNTIHVSLG